MKKGLLGSTALIAASLVVGAGSAQAENEKINLGLSGYMEQWIGYTDQDDVGGATDLNGFNTNSDTEVAFVGSSTLDNGITFGVNIQLEGNSNAGDQIDESYLFMKGSFGEVLLGSENSAQYKMSTSAPDVGIGINSGDQTAWVSFAGVGGTGGTFRGPFGSTAVEAARANDVNRVTYFTPRFAGFQFGGSYAPQNREDAFGSFDRDAVLHDGVSFGANYNGDFNAVSITVAGGYGQWDNPVGSDPDAYNVGARIGFAGFTIGGSFASADNNAGSGDAEGYDFGASYGIGPWGISLGYFHGDRDGAAGATAAAGALKAENDTFAGSAAYALGPGIKFKATLAYTKIDDESGLGVDNEATYFVIGPALSF